MSFPSRTFRLISIAVLTVGDLSTLHAGDSSLLSGHWRFDAEQSTDLSPWRDYALTITVVGDVVTFDRQLGAGRRGFTDRMTIAVSRDENVVPVEMRPENRHIGVYIGGDQTKRVRATWLDGSRILRLSTDLVLATQQGEYAVNILSDYKVSGNGSRLTLTELRSTRNRPIVYTFSRAD